MVDFLRSPVLSWAAIVPVLAIATLARRRNLEAVLVTAVAAALAGAVLAMVHHAEVVAHRIGESFGSLVLAVAVTVIEVALIVALMVSGGPDDTASLARDTVFAAVMITTNGIVCSSLLTCIAELIDQKYSGTIVKCATYTSCASPVRARPDSG